MNTLESQIIYTIKINLPSSLKELSNEELAVLIDSKESPFMKAMQKLLMIELSSLSKRIDSPLSSENTNGIFFDNGRDRGARDKILEYLNISELAKLELKSRKVKTK